MDTMKRVTGIGGIFFKAKDAPALQAWYKRHLGIDVQEWGGTAFTWTDGEGKPVAGTTIWSIGSAQSDHFAPSTATFMVNYRVEDLHALVQILREEGCNVLEKIDDSEKVCLGHRSRRKQGRALATACRPMIRKAGERAGEVGRIVALLAIEPVPEYIIELPDGSSEQAIESDLEWAV
jgi:hypothetical protein